MRSSVAAALNERGVLVLLAVHTGAGEARDLFRETIAEVRHLNARGVVGRELLSGRYHRHSSGFSSMLKDVLLRDVRTP